MLSGYARDDIQFAPLRGDVASRIPQSGIAGFIQKPFSLNDLRRTLHDLLC